MACWQNLGEVLELNAKKYPGTVCLRDRLRSFTFPETNERVCRLSQALLSLGLRPGDKFSVLLENCIEFVELYLAAAKTGLVINPINFRLVGKEISYIVRHADARAFVVHDEFCPTVEEIRGELTEIPADRFVVVGATAARPGYLPYEELLAGGVPRKP
ncbi:MAG: AMP-binding protein, partial [Deltaproteobacteria bacterium]|nr:AMP-binding protein [Deltaproteobacteria bacterium]